MNSKALVSLLLLVLAHTGCARGEEGEDRIKKALTRKVSFEFVDTPLTDVLGFVRQLGNITIVVDPKALDGRDKTSINLRVADMEMGQALDWVLKLAEMEYKIQDQAIFIYSPDEKKAADKKPKHANDAAVGILRAKFATGDAIEADAAMLERLPHLSQEILSMAFDPVKDDILVLVPGRDIPLHVEVRAFIESAKAIAPGATFKFDDNLKLLYIQSKEGADLRRINAVARALRHAPPPAPIVAEKPQIAPIKPPRPPDDPNAKAKRVTKNDEELQF